MSARAPALGLPLRRLARLTVAVLTIALVALTGCSRDDGQASRKVAVSIPLAPAAHFPPTGTLRAFVIVDGGSRIPLTVTDDSVSGTLSGVARGEREIRIIVEFEHNTFGVVELANVTLMVTVGEGVTQVVFDASDYVFPNDDGDVYTNLTEILADSNPFDGTSVPGPGSVPGSRRWNTMRWGQSNWQ